MCYQDKFSLFYFSFNFSLITFFHDNKISSSLSSTSRLKNNSPFKKHLLKFTCTNIITSNKFIPSNYITKKKKRHHRRKSIDHQTVTRMNIFPTRRKRTLRSNETSEKFIVKQHVRSTI